MKMSETAAASEFQSLCHFSSSDLYHGRIAIYSLSQKLYLQGLDAIVSQSSSSMKEGEGNNSDDAYCHKPLGKVEVGNVGGVEVGKIGKVQVCKLGTAQLGNLDKPTSFNELEQHVGTTEEELI